MQRLPSPDSSLHSGSLPRSRRCRREQLMLDQEVQGMLIGRVVRYWLVCLVAVVIFSWCWSAWTSPQPVGGRQLIMDLAPGLLGSLLVLPLVIADILRASNRFVGPIHRLRNALKRSQLGDEIPRLAPRRGDYWQDLTQRFNQLIARESSADNL